MTLKTISITLGYGLEPRKQDRKAGRNNVDKKSGTMRESEKKTTKTFYAGKRWRSSGDTSKAHAGVLKDIPSSIVAIEDIEYLAVGDGC